MRLRLRSSLKALPLVLLGLGLSTVSQAQIGLIMAATRLGTSAVMLATADNQYACKGPGSYQLTSAEWQPAPLVLTNNGLTAGKGKEAKQFNLAAVQQVVVRTDTFAVVRNVKFPDAKDVATVPVLGQRVWRRPQVELFTFHGAGGDLYMLRFPDQKALVLPGKAKDFRAAMLKLVGDQPVLAEQLRKEQLDAQHTRGILDTYLRWKPSGFDTAAAFAAEPAAK